MGKSFRFIIICGILIWPFIANAQSISPSGPTLNINTTPIVGGTSGKLFYDNVGTIGEFTLSGDCTFAQPTITCASAGLTIGTSAITSGTDTRILFQDGTTIGENANFTFAKTAGTLTIPNGALAGPALVVGPSSGFGFYKGVNGLAVVDSSQDQLQLGSNNANIPTVFLQSGGSIGWSVNSSSQSQSADLFLYRKGAANLQHGQNDAAVPVPQIVSVQSVVAGTSNTAGANWTIKGSAGTGTGVGGDIIFQVAIAGGSGTAQNAFSTAFTISGTTGLPKMPTSTVAGLPTCNAGALASEVYVTDQLTACPVLDGTFTGGGAVKCHATCNGTNWVH